MSIRGKWLLKFLSYEEESAVKLLEELAKLMESSEEGLSYSQCLPDSLQVSLRKESLVTVVPHGKSCQRVYSWEGLQECAREDAGSPGLTLKCR